MPKDKFFLDDWNAWNTDYHTIEEYELQTNEKRKYRKLAARNKQGSGTTKRGTT